MGLTVGRLTERRAFQGLASLAVLAWLPPCADGQCRYEVTQLDYPIDCGFDTVVTSGLGLNNGGAVVGSYKCAASEHTEAFLWTPEEGFVTLPRPPGVCSSAATDINDDGVIVGTFGVVCSPRRGFVYEDGVFTTLPPVEPVAGATSNAAALNNLNVVVGRRSLAQGLLPYTAYSWTVEKGFADLGTAYGERAWAIDVNDSNQVAGSVGPFFEDEAFVWDSEGIRFLGPIPNGYSSTAAAINESGDVAGVGGMDLPSGETVTRAFLWTAGEMRIIEPLTGYDTSTARSLNDSKQVVGDGRKLANPNDRRAYLWQHGTTHDLSDLPAGTFQRGWAINDMGQILAHGGVHSFLLTPVDRPLGDLDIDCVVGMTDLFELFAEWGQPGSAADLDGDGTVDLLDLMILIENWA